MKKQAETAFTQVIALLLAAIGIDGVLPVPRGGQPMHEIGIGLVLDARPADTRRDVLAESGWGLSSRSGRLDR